MEESNLCNCEKSTFFDVRQARAVLLSYLCCGRRMMRSRSAEIDHFPKFHGAVKSRHGLLVEKVHRWLPAFDSLLAKQSKQMGPGELRGRRILRIQHRIVMIQISNPLSTTATIFDAHVHEFEEAVSLVEAEMMIDSSKWTASQLNPNFFFQI
jgi:hypothetical protein